MATKVDFIEELYGHVIEKVEQISDDEIRFFRDDGMVVRMLHHHDCCESVFIHDIDGDLNNLTGYVVEAEVVTNDEFKPPENDKIYYDADHLWTFYKIATVNEFVNIRWLGTSNGYYCIEVNTELCRKDEL